MSFIFCPFYKLLLKENIRERIMLKIEDIQVCNSWLNLNLCINQSDLDLSSINYDEIVKEMNLWEDFAKLSVDLWRDFDHYRKFTFESQSDCKDYRNRLESLGFINKDGIWKCVQKPNEDAVQTCVFMFCLYRLMFNEISHKEIVEESLVCTFCDYVIKYGEEKCWQCNADVVKLSLPELITNNKNENKKTNNNVKEICRESMDEISDNCKSNIVLLAMDLINPIYKQRLKSYQLNWIDIQENVKCICCEDIIPSNMDKCGKCQFIVKDVINAAIQAVEMMPDKIYKKVETEMIPRCNCINERFEKVNTANCVSIGEYIKVNLNSDKSNDNKSVSIINNKETQCIMQYDNFDGRDQWKCSKCGLIHPNGDIICDGCGSSKIASGTWNCTECTLTNSCMAARCAICCSQNAYLMEKFCERCNNNRVSQNKRYCDNCVRSNKKKYPSIRWQCQYVKCKEYNKNNEEYCHACRLQCNYSRARGDNVKVWHNGKESNVWICYKCYTINGVHDLMCRQCKDTRYRKKYCQKCRQYNDGTTNECDKCFQEY